MVLKGGGDVTSQTFIYFEMASLFFPFPIQYPSDHWPVVFDLSTESVPEGVCMELATL